MKESDISAQHLPPRRIASSGDLGPGGRIVAAVLALVWIAAGAVVIIFGLRRGAWFAVILGVPALIYGAMWITVARTGRRLQWPGRRRKE